ncbi:FtsK/SpoIIIE domain-containing protein [Kineosporia succinea]|uniref:FtsK domain-containing protein n=1 Tax=Kineosporia succinea TaxID=84632 RepID=A0ABT9PDU0_9ACTN|nr:FtsK/SpoIIIE domain-containing protein [Kineosporia succinea]MDP9830873.1 hypothetical protein [Kineosporia succinea]
MHVPGDLLGLDRLLPPLLPDAGLGLGTRSLQKPLHAPIGFDDASVRWADLSGHTLVAGPGGSGRSSTICTLMAGLALLGTPREVQFYVLATGPGPADLADLPHVGGVVDPQDRPAVIGLLQHLAARPDHDVAIYLVVDCPAQLARLGPELIATADAAPGREVHLLISADDADQVPEGLRTWFSTRVDLEPDARGRVTELGGGSAAQTFTGVAARIGIPGEGESAAQARRRLAGDVSQVWHPREGAPRVPGADASSGTETRDRTRAGARVHLGEGGPVHDFGRHRALIVRGARASGKSALLRDIAGQLVEGRTPAEVRVLLVDHRAGLMDAVDESYLLGHAFHAAALRDLVDGTLWALSGRRGDTDWRGPRLYVLVDDHVHAADDEDIWAPVLEHLEAAADSGVHLVLAEAADAPAAVIDDEVSSITLSQALLDIGAASVDLEPGSVIYRAGGQSRSFAKPADFTAI